MAALIDKLFEKSQADAIRKLWEDNSSRSLIQQELGKKLIDSDDFIDEFPLTQIMFISTMSPFASSVNECYSVADVVYWGIHRVDILPLVSEHKGKELAYRCLISLSMFEAALVKRYNRYGAPSPSFYRKVGEKSFEQIGMNDIGKHFYQWENFIREMFI